MLNVKYLGIHKRYLLNFGSANGALPFIFACFSLMFPLEVYVPFKDHLMFVVDMQETETEYFDFGNILKLIIKTGLKKILTR